VDWIHVTEQGPVAVLVNTVMSLQVKKKGEELINYLSDY
jgi:hypothetical protein